MKTFVKVVFVIFIVVAIAYYFVVVKNNKPLDVLGQVQDFELIDQNNNNFGYQNLKDKIWAVNFIFTSCQGVCPVMTKNMSEVEKNFSDNPNVNFVSISVDPETDTPEILKNYREKHNVDIDHWHFLTGEREKIKKIMFDDMKLGYADDTIFHSDRMVLIDGQMRIRGYYTGTEKKEYTKLANDISKLVKDQESHL